MARILIIDDDKSFREALGESVNKIFSETKLKMPVLTYGAEFSLGDSMLQGVRKVAERCRKKPAETSESK